MDDARQNSRTPAAIAGIVDDTDALGFDMASEPKVGALLMALAASKPGARFLELGTGTGHGTAWILGGMDATSRLDTVDTDPDVVAVAKRHLATDRRVTFHIADGSDFMRTLAPGSVDFIYADAWPGKFSHLDEALALLRCGGMYVIDDLLPQPNWPEGHGPKVAALIAALERRSGFVTVKLAWGSGVLVAVRVSSV